MTAIFTILHIFEISLEVKGWMCKFWIYIFNFKFFSKSSIIHVCLCKDIYIIFSIHILHNIMGKFGLLRELGQIIRARKCHSSQDRSGGVRISSSLPLHCHGRAAQSLSTLHGNSLTFFLPWITLHIFSFKLLNSIIYF